MKRINPRRITCKQTQWEVQAVSTTDPARKAAFVAISVRARQLSWVFCYEDLETLLTGNA